jgi:hypothetical protein
MLVDALKEAYTSKTKTDQRIAFAQAFCFGKVLSVLMRVEGYTPVVGIAPSHLSTDSEAVNYQRVVTFLGGDENTARRWLGMDA